MTIRYKCEECESVLKVRDELAGTDGKCPKCNTVFVVPQLEEPLDLPRAVTPSPDFSRLIDIQRDTAAEDTAVPAAGAEEGAPKPSIAELMREHEEKKARKQKRREQSARGGLKEAAGVAEVVTSGSAADVITRNYDQRRDTAGEPPPMTREERREFEQREALVRWAKRTVPAVGGFLLMLYFFIAWLNSESVPPLYSVEGVVSVNGVPQEGVEVRFAPVPTDDDSKEAASRHSSRGYTNAEGKFVLEYTRGEESYTGAVEGEHTVFITDPYGVSYNLGEHALKVVERSDNVIDLPLIGQ